MPWTLIETEVDGGKVNWVEVHPTQVAAINSALRDAVTDGVIKDTPDERERLAATLREDECWHRSRPGVHCPQWFPVCET